MAIQTINLTVPGGDTPRSANTKINANFSNTTHAASRLMGTGDNQVIDASMAFFSANTKLNGDPDVFDCDTFSGGTRYYFNNASGKTINLPPVVYTSQVWLVETIMIANGGTLIQYATHGLSGDRFRRIYWSGNTNGWTEWLTTSANKQSYDTTSTSGANVVVTSSGKLVRSTSIAYTNTNTTKDSNGFIKAASPIVKVFADKVELNGEAVDQDVGYKKNGVGDYTITTVSGLSTDGWYIELPKDMNGNPKVAVTLSEVDGVISLKTYKRIFSMETFTFEPDLDNPLDIPDTRWIDLRLNEIPVEEVNP